MKIFLTGGTGFVGGFIVDELLRRNHGIVALVHTPDKAKKLRDRGVTLVKGDVLSKDTLKMEGCDAVIHLVGIIQEKKNAAFEKIHVGATANVVVVAKKSGIKRLLHMSALGTRENARSRYHKTKFAAERIVIESGLTYTIFRPSVIFGEGDKFLNMLKNFYRNPIFVPVIGGGNFKLQPVFARDVARLYADALENENTKNKIFEIGGPQAYSFVQLLDEVGNHIGKKRLKIHMPITIMALAAWVMEKVLPSPPITTDQLIMLQEDNVCDTKEIEQTFNITLTPLRDGMRE